MKLGSKVPHIIAAFVCALLGSLSFASEDMQRRLAQEAAEAAMRQHNMSDSDRAAMDFISEVRKKVEYIWAQPADVANDEHVTIELELNEYGAVKKIEVLQATGNHQLNDSALQAIIQAAPFSNYRDLSPDKQADLSRFTLSFTPKR